MSYWIRKFCMKYFTMFYFFKKHVKFKNFYLMSNKIIFNPLILQSNKRLRYLKSRNYRRVRIFYLRNNNVELWRNYRWKIVLLEVTFINLLQSMNARDLHHHKEFILRWNSYLGYSTYKVDINRKIMNRCTKL